MQLKVLAIESVGPQAANLKRQHIDKGPGEIAPALFVVLDNTLF